MKRLIAVMMAVMLCAALLAACSKKAPAKEQPKAEESVEKEADGSETEKSEEAEESADAAESSEQTEETSEAPADSFDIKAEIKTIGDATRLTQNEETEFETSMFDDQFVFVFKKNGVYYRVVAPMTQEQSDALWEMEEQNDEYFKLIDAMEITSYENLSANQMTEEEINALTGKTGADLLNDGWTIWGYDLNDKENLCYYLGHGFFMYRVGVEGDFEYKEGEEIDGEEVLKGMKIKSFELEGLNDGCNLELKGTPIE